MEADTVVLMITIVGSVLGSTLATISLLLSHMNRLEDKFDEEFKTVHGRVQDHAPEHRRPGERLARVEGHLMAPEGFTPRTSRLPAIVDPPPEDPGTGHQQAG